MQNKYIADYCPTNSFVHKLNPSIKLIGFGVLLFLFLISNDLMLIMPCLIGVSVLILFSNVPIKFYFKIVYTFIPVLMLLTLILTLFGIDINTVGIIILKIVILLMNLMLIIHTTSTNNLVTGIMKIVNLFNIFFINMNKFGILICQILKFIPTFYRTFYGILDSRATRGIDYKYSTIIGKWIAIKSCLKRVLALTLIKLYILGHDMKQRLFNLNTNRIKINFRALSFNDYIIFAFHLLLLYYFVVRIR